MNKRHMELAAKILSQEPTRKQKKVSKQRLNDMPAGRLLSDIDQDRPKVVYSPQSSWSSITGVGMSEYLGDGYSITKKL